MSEKTFEKGVSDPTQKLDGSGLRICIVHTRWNYALVDNMYKSVYETLINKYGVLAENIFTVNIIFYSTFFQLYLYKFILVSFFFNKKKNNLIK